MIEQDRFVCTKENPWTKYEQGMAIHPQATWTDNGSDYYDEYKCPHCGLIFQVELGD